MATIRTWLSTIRKLWVDILCLFDEVRKKFDEFRSIFKDSIIAHELIQAIVTLVPLQEKIADRVREFSFRAFFDDLQVSDSQRVGPEVGRAEIRAAEEIASRNPCPNFDDFKHLFLKVQDELKDNIRQSRRFIPVGDDAGLNVIH